MDSSYLSACVSGLFRGENALGSILGASLAGQTQHPRTGPIQPPEVLVHKTSYEPDQEGIAFASS